jgi:hypothetical protein
LQKAILEDNFSSKNQKLQSKSQPRFSQKLKKIQYFSSQFLFHFFQEFFQKWEVLNPFYHTKLLKQLLQLPVKLLDLSSKEG